MDKVILFGAGNTGKRVADEQGSNIRILCFMDSDPDKQGEWKGIKILNPSRELFTQYEYDYILITSMAGENEIRNKLISWGIPDFKIKSSKKKPMSKIFYFENLRMLFEMRGTQGAVAEVGVFRGDTAEILNRVYRDRELHLFDTFEGFNEKDIAEEREHSFSEAKTGEYNNSSEEYVKSRMSYPDRVHIYKGFFPDTAVGLTGEFCLVRIDLDLYRPTVEALKLFHGLMANGGVVLVDDYFGGSYLGIKEAVDDYISLHDGLLAYPLGDRCGIAIYGY